MVMTGLKATKVEVEVDGTRGQPALIVIGLPNKAIDEAKERISSALTNCGIRVRSIRTIVNLAPAEVKKTSSALELAIAVGLLKMYGELTWDTDRAMFFGELSLDGSLKPVRGLFPMVLAAKEMGVKRIFFPRENSQEVAVVRGLTLYPIEHLRQLLGFATRPIKPLLSTHSPQFSRSTDDVFGQMVGQEQAKRAIQIAAAGRHNMLLIGSPGAGKSMLARAMRSILPPLSEAEAIEVTKLYSLRGLAQQGLIVERPFREPHHTTSTAGLIGGGHTLQPGEISLAHLGVLFLDEFPEYSQSSLEALRQPMEDGRVVITRVNGSVEYPARFMLVAAANPCPCGYQFHSTRQCQCSEREISRYQRRISGPILDRIDIQLKMQSIDPERFAQQETVFHQTERARQTVALVQQRQLKRQGKTNAVLSYKQLRQFGGIQPAVWHFCHGRRVGFSSPAAAI
ncbi:MAG: Mg chelatase, subunit ChlI [Candidatus Pacebacteria bacterium GW2011_GWB1_47_8]|nr:MAG: Mg chelatase, subunit ChlI [Candidatus Pacebacteria bacterium GW2011_GWA1_46_10]KKU84542.1 MAG: Mg chelatase, subunit ChlI [Candidatus Pacebacteria bacterium GW2011_GWB1_47_8]